MGRDVTRTRSSAGLARSARVAVLALLTSLLALPASLSSPSVPSAAADEPVCTVSAKLVNSCRPWLGAESGGYGVSAFRARMLEHEARIGRQVDIVHAYTGPGAVLSNDMVTLARRPATIALINWKPSYVWASAGGQNLTVNTQIDRMAASIKALGETRMMLTIYHEPEASISAGGSPSCPNQPLNGTSGTTADYVNMWQNVRHRFDALGVDNVVWVMNYTGYVTGHCLTKDLWPGNDYVDWVMWDPYTKNAGWTASVGSFYNYLTNNSDAEHDFVSKPWGLAEFGYVGSDQNAAYRMYDDIRYNLANNVHPRLKAYVVWDNHTSSSHDDRVGFTEDGVRDPVEQEHYNAFANDPLLTGTWVPEPTDQVAPTVALTGPGAGGPLNGTVAVTGAASDDVGVTSVSLLVDDGEVAASPPGADGAVSFDWNSFTVPNGSHTLQLRARDAAGNLGYSEAVGVEVANVDEEPPTPPGAVTASWSRPSQVSVTWSASSDNAAVTGYRVHRDGEPIATLGPDARSHTDAGVANLTTYAYQVTALDATGLESEPSETRTVETGDDTAPSTPTVEAVLTGPDGATVSWTAATDNGGVAGYRVYRNGTVLDTVDEATLSLLDSGLDDGVGYAYRVVAFDTAGNDSTLSDPATVTTPDTTAPTAPGSLSAVSGLGSVTLSWTAATDNLGVASYAVHRDGQLLTTVAASARTYTDSDLDATTAHEYHVTALDAAGLESPPSNTVTRSFTDGTAPSAPTGLARTISGFTVRLTWRASSDNVGVTVYTVYRGGVAVGTSTTTAYVDSTAPPGRTHTYTVRASDAAGNLSAASNSVSATLPADRTAPTSPTGLRATAGATGSRQITVTWNAATDNAGVTNYYLFRGNARYRLLGNVLGYTDTGLTAGTTYTYKVYAIDASGNWSGSSGKASATAR